MVVGKRGTLLAVFVTCFLAQVLSQLTPREPRVDCPVGYTNQKTWFFNQRRNNEWGSLCPAYATCGTGFRQSPVNIPSLATNGRTPAKLQLSLGTVAVNLIRHADYLTFPVSNPNNTLNWRGATWTLNRIEFHSPSEHTIQGRYANFEVQLYFNNAGRTEQAAVALLFNCGGACDDAFFARVIPALPSRFRCQCGNGRTEVYNPYGAEQCDQGADNANVPNRCRPNCQLPRCGDGVTDDKNREECDTGAVNVTAGQTCRPNCILPYCGDGIVDAGERCDKGIWWEGSGCTGSCQPECGDACLQPGEQCDYGIAGVGNINVTINHNDTAQAVTGSTCRFNCLWSRCGDNITDFNEECDWGDYNNANSTGGALLPSICRPNCTKPFCGDGIVDPEWSNVNATGTPFGGEQCEPSLSPQYCQPNCSWNCGNGRLDFNETCDNGTLNSLGRSNASNPLCRPWNSVTPCRPASCGDQIVDFGEDCDSGGVDTWLCFRNCTFRCGNRQIDADFNETCDNGNPLKFPARANDGNSDTRPNACRMNCQLYRCGDGVVDNLGCEQCDTGANRSDTAPNACRTSCRNAYCGDGVVDAGEECDDRNNVDDDGCSCCRRDCGNGIKQGNEDCDDGAANSNTLPDRCRLNCRRHFCGDGVVDSDEECDAGVAGSSTCTPRCTRTFCGDGVRQADQGEECDAGADNSYTALSGCSPVCTLNTCGQTLSGWNVDLNLLVPSSTIGTFTYAGSETRPPCTQNVRWFVVQQPRLLTAAQCRSFANIIPPATNRYLQGLYGRNPIAAPTTGVGMPPNDPRARPVCGDGIVQVGEECDDGRENDDAAPDACRTNCRANRCGDKVKDAGEECDGESYCLPSCKMDRRARRQAPPSDGQCSGNRQSPIRLPESCPRARALNLNHPSNVQYNPTPIVLFNTGNNILFPALNGGTFSYRGVTYNLAHIEFHEPSEHVIGNRRFPFEVQLFHKSQNPGPQTWAVLSILFAEGSNPNSVLQPVLDRLPPVSECACGNGIKEDIQAFPDGTWVREECDDGMNNNDELPNRCRSNCRMSYCGDGIIDSCKEQCDRGVLNAFLPNRCRPTCVLPYCGDGVADDLMGETCDDGNNVNGDGCNSNCQVECGDGVQGQNEECDLGVYNSNEKASGCRTNCKLPRCGDGILDIGEQCDSGNLSATVPNACRPNCTLPICGDGVVDAGEQCDNGILNGNSTCTVTCTLLCGNGRVDNATGEQCDNGAANSNTVPNACRTNCRLPRCGDGVRDDGEDCDTGANTRQCQNCRVVCGNGILEAGEECDDGIYNSDTVPNACRTNCFLWACGDGVFDALEECDDGRNNANRSDACRPWCSIPKCGDGIVDTGRGETCDDGNILDGDGCSCSCQKECGNGRVDPGEQCDDGPRNNDTRPACCRTNCRLPRCGDGVTDPGEECDDAGQNIAGPNYCRPDCTLPKCGDGIVDHLYGELCDQGGRNSLTVIDGCSPTCQPNVCRQSVSLNVTINPGALLPTAPGTFHYPGSLTSAGCSENADWFVFANPVPISGCQLAQFRRVLSNNNRCLQARNGRPVNFLEVTAKCGDGIVEGNEECDAGPANSDFAPNACRRNCRLPRCGDGIQDKGEQCDGTPNCSQTCTFSCAAGNGTGAAASAGAVASDNNEININFERILAQ